MKHCSYFIILVDILALCYAGNRVSLELPKTIFYEEIAYGSCTAYHLKKPPVHIRVYSTTRGCSANKTGNFYNTTDLDYRQNLKVMCENGSGPSVDVTCFVVTRSGSLRTTTQIQVAEKPEPTIITKPQNIITAVGLPVTLTCHVEGDPSSYWVGWMSQHAIIQEGEDHSISTSPSFKSTNGTVHHLTIHRVKESGKYHCEVYTISKKVDQVTHQVIADDENDNESSPPSYFSALSKLFF